MHSQPWDPSAAGRSNLGKTEGCTPFVTAGGAGGGRSGGGRSGGGRSGGRSEGGGGPLSSTESIRRGCSLAGSSAAEGCKGKRMCYKFDNILTI